ncbi:hypothetical protein PybrP1_007994 [[Pythium] brassicae (nom. inval.)]|nr:hypothetical protein PybrP1_007994 [[Pythium] brassicae (nom. inval.)]
MPNSLDLVTAAWRAILGGAAPSSTIAAAVADLAAGRRILESIQLALAHALRLRGGRAHALTTDEIAPIKALCDELLPAHFQLKVPDVQPTASLCHKPRRVRYQHIWEDDQFSMGIFILPPGASIPLHDHPEMSVISRVLYGSLHVRSCDLVAGSPARTSAAAPLMARVCADEEIHAPHTAELLPDHGNLHEFVAGDALGCAIFDILTPPYEPDDGRDCTYYRVVGDWPSGAATAAPSLVALEMFDPEHFAVVSEPYTGPPLGPLPALPPPAATTPSPEAKPS